MISTKEGMLSTTSQEIETMISEAIKKINGKNENALCRYLPMKEGYMHHFTLRKMKHHDPEQLAKMIKSFIIDANELSLVPPKQRAARGSRKKHKDQIVLTKADIDRILQMARSLGDKDVVRKLTPKKDFRAIKRDLISAIRQNRVEDAKPLFEDFLHYADAMNSSTPL